MMEKSFCLLTPPGRSAVATTHVRGDDIAAQLAMHFVTASSRPIQLTPRRPAFGFWKNDGQASEGLVVCLLDDYSADIHSHGGSLAPKMIANSLQNSGFAEISTTQLALESNSKWAEEVQAALLLAQTPKTAKRLLKLYQLTAEKLEELRETLTTQPNDAKREIASALELGAFGLHLIKPWKIVICGQPNVGKSSLINTLSGYARALVHDAPGTTRDTITQFTAIDGWPVELTDTAGIRWTDDEIEKQGVQRAIAEAQQADLRIAMFDSSKHWSESDSNLLNLLQADLIVHNKSDQQIEDSNRPEGISISTVQPSGLQRLLQSVTDALVPAPPSRDRWMPVNETQLGRLEEIWRLLDSNEPDAIEKAVNLLR